MLSLLTGAELSAAQVARELDISQANASYHLRLLADAGLLAVVGQETVRGGKAKLYRHVWDAPSTPQPDGAPETRESREAYVAALTAAVNARYLDRMAGTPTLTTDADLWVEPAVWDEVLELVGRASRLMHAQARPPRSEGTVRANLSLIAFRLRDDSKGPR